ncbi:protein CHLOROPLAST IMPORT APPARATUS 2-like isoform 1 [Hibiscus syriacus]|uniref:Protein CHLOROPLAST IMPORT APPARATUS 2-like isoform 1 n=1 Tax=Hibiscus syriacus TaxID=106335 RepID=A0A6A2X2Z8_HIBSY|nr:protein CHLOROPLAST IMPORT APPARATUS 2-like isoform 1 [Hibiscus syriacus]
MELKLSLTIGETHGSLEKKMSKLDEMLEETPPYVVADERMVELEGEALKVLKAFEAVVRHLRKFFVDQIVLPLFEKTVVINQELQAETRAERSSLHTVSQSGIGVDLPVTARRDFLFLEHEKQFESQIPSSGIPFYGQDLPHSIVHSSSGLHRSVVPIVTQDIIGIGGVNIAHIRRTSGAVITVQESGALFDEIIVEIKGTSTQVQFAQQLIQEFISFHQDPIRRSNYKETSYRSPFSQLGSNTSSLLSQTYDGYGGSSSWGGGIDIGAGWGGVVSSADLG